MFEDQGAQLQNGAHANKLLGPTSISVVFSSRISTMGIRKGKAEVVLSPWEPQGDSLGKVPRDLPGKHPSSV
jgi:hypothetical protein